MAAFDPNAYIAKRNETEAAVRAGKPLEPKPEVKAAPAAVVVEDDPSEPDDVATEKHAPTLPRAVRRELNRLRTEKALAEGRLLAYQEMGIKPGEKPEPKPAVAAADDPEPQRKDFPDDAAYNRALGRWDARQETKKVIDTSDQEKQRIDELKREMAEADTQAAEDKKLFDDWDEKLKAGADIEIDFTVQKDLAYMMGTSKAYAKLLYYFADGHGEELQKLLDLNGNIMAQDRFFRKLEGRVETMYTTQQKSKKPEAQAETAAERDAKKHKPSGADAPKGGSAPVTTIQPMNADGTVNQAWLAQRNERSGRR